MAVNYESEQKARNTHERENFTIYDEWEKFGLTNHMGGLQATRRLIELCGITPGQYILNVGCGTGYTAYLLAKNIRLSLSQQTSLRPSEKKRRKELREEREQQSESG